MTKTAPPEFQAIVLAGYGQRLSTLVENANGVPKALLPIANKPMIAYVLQWLERAGITEILIVAQTGAATKVSEYLAKLHESQLSARVELVPTAEYGTADVLRSLRDRIRSDFIVVGCDVLTDVPLEMMMDVFRLQQPALVTLLAEPQMSDVGSSGAGGNGRPASTHSSGGNQNAADDVDAIFVGLDAANESLVYLKSADECYDKFDMRMAVLRRHSTVNVYSTLRDMHVYIFHRWVMDFIVQRKDLSSLREDLLPLLVRLQSSRRLIETENIDKLISANIPRDELFREMVADDDLGLAADSLISPTKSLSLSTPRPSSMAALSPASTAAATSAALDACKDSGESEQDDDDDDDDENADKKSQHGTSRPLSVQQRAELTRCIAFVPTVVADSTSSATIPAPQSFTSPSTVARNTTVAQYCLRTNTVPAYIEMNRYFMRQAAAPGSAELRVSSNAEIHQRTQVGPDSMVGAGTKIDERSSVKKSVLGAHCSVGRNVKISNSIVMDYVVVGDGVKLDNTIVCHSATIKERSALKDCEVAAHYVVDAAVTAKGEHFIEARHMSTDDEGY